MELNRYLTRVGYRGPRSPTLDALTALHRAHLLAIPYENLDIHLGRRLSLDPERIYHKLVEERRGGWCYEMNGLFATMLERLGFEVTLVAGTVGRGSGGQPIEGNHLVVIVTLDRPYLVDVGFGDGFLEPLPLAAGTYHRGGFTFALRRDGPRWILQNHSGGAAEGFDFTEAPRALSSFQGPCDHLQTAASSSFVQKTVCQRHTRSGIVTLRGAVLREVTPEGATDAVVAGLDEFASILRNRFGLELPAGEVAELWNLVTARHQAWVAAGGG